MMTPAIFAAYRENGVASRAHGSRGRRPHNATLPVEAAAVVALTTHGCEVATHGGTYLVFGGETSIVEGDQRPGTVEILEF